MRVVEVFSFIPFPSQLQRIVENEKTHHEKTAKQKLDLQTLQTLPTRAYLDQTVVPILLQGLSVLAKERYVEEPIVTVLPLFSFHIGNIRRWRDHSKYFFVFISDQIISQLPFHI